MMVEKNSEKSKDSKEKIANAKFFSAIDEIQVYADMETFFLNDLNKLTDGKDKVGLGIYGPINYKNIDGAQPSGSVTYLLKDSKKVLIAKLTWRTEFNACEGLYLNSVSKDGEYLQSLSQVLDEKNNWLDSELKKIDPEKDGFAEKFESLLSDDMGLVCVLRSLRKNPKVFLALKTESGFNIFKI